MINSRSRTLIFSLSLSLTTVANAAYRANYLVTPDGMSNYLINTKQFKKHHAKTKDPQGIFIAVQNGYGFIGIINNAGNINTGIAKSILIPRSDASFNAISNIHLSSTEGYSAKISLGYRFNSYISVALGYLLTPKLKVTVDGFLYNKEIMGEPANLTSSLSKKSYDLQTKIYLRPHGSWLAYLLTGAVYQNQTQTITIKVPNASKANESQRMSTETLRPEAGLGFAWQANSHIAITIEYNYIFGTKLGRQLLTAAKDDNVYDYKVLAGTQSMSSILIGLQYNI